MLKIQNQATKRIRVVLIIMFIVQIFLTAQPYVWDETGMMQSASGENVTAELGDTIEINSYATVDGKPFKDSKIEGKGFVLEADSYFSGFGEKLAGHTKGETFTFKTKLPDNFSDESVAGKTAEFKVTITNINKKLIFTALDYVQLIGSESDQSDRLNTIGFCYLSFLVIPVVALGFQLFDFYYNLKNIVGFIASLLGVLAIINFVGAQYICIGSVIALILYLFSAFFSVMGILARYQHREESIVKKKEYKPDDIV